MPTDRLSINHYSIRQWDLVELIEGCKKSGISSIGLWRDKVNSLESAKRLIDETGITVSSLCRGGFFPYTSDEDRLRTRSENHQAIDEAAALGSPLLVLVCGGLTPSGLERDREMVLEGIAELVPYAKARGVRLGVEPLHPMFAANRSVVSTLAHANDVANYFPSDIVGVVIDTYHVWWDPSVYSEIDRAGARIFAFHVSDWLVPPPDFLNGRGLMGDGCIDFAKLTTAITKAGYDGPIEVEIFNEQFWSLLGEQALALIKKRFDELIRKPATIQKN